MKQHVIKNFRVFRKVCIEEGDPSSMKIYGCGLEVYKPSFRRPFQIPTVSLAARIFGGGFAKSPTLVMKDPEQMNLMIHLVDVG